jgi:hypothetical protein
MGNCIAGFVFCNKKSQPREGDEMAKSEIALQFVIVVFSSAQNFLPSSAKADLCSEAGGWRPQSQVYGDGR